MGLRVLEKITEKSLSSEQQTGGWVCSYVGSSFGVYAESTLNTPDLVTSSSKLLSPGRAKTWGKPGEYRVAGCRENSLEK